MSESGRTAGKNPPVERKPLTGVRKAAARAADMVSLRYQLHAAEKRARDAYVRLGELAYAKYRPRRNAVPEEIEKGMADGVSRVTELSHEIAELKLRIRLLKSEGK